MGINALSWIYGKSFGILQFAFLVLLSLKLIHLLYAYFWLPICEQFCIIGKRRVFWKVIGKANKLKEELEIQSKARTMTLLRTLVAGVYGFVWNVFAFNGSVSAS